MRLNRVALMLSMLLFITFATSYVTQLASAAGAVRPLEIGLYWNEECTNPVSSVSFGIMTKGESRDVTFWLESHSMDKGRISWDSANFNPSSKAITETWERKVGNLVYIANWNKKMKTGDLWKIHYIIQVAQDTQTGVYSWDLIVCFHASHKTSCLSVSCVLAVTE